MSVVLVVGGGGREHAMVRALCRSPAVAMVYSAPGNPGIEDIYKAECVQLDVKCHHDVVEFCLCQSVALVAIGPEAPLAAGLSDALSTAGIKVFGPSQAAAVLEYDKAAAKAFMERHGIPTAAFRTFTDTGEAKAFLATSEWGGWAIKAAGLAGGKGVIVTSDRGEAVKAVDELTQAHGAAASTLVIEERLHGPEISALCFTDGITLALLPLAQDHKARLVGNTGPNTGGMGAVCPYPVTQDTRQACENILTKTVRSMAAEKKEFRGVLYAGLMLCHDGPRVLEYNCRFGDPETQSLLSLLDSDLFHIMQACATGSLAGCLPLQFRPHLYACGVVVVTRRYPVAADNDLPITGLSKAAAPCPAGCSVFVYHSSTKRNSAGELCTAGGRIVTVVATAADAECARRTATQRAKLVKFTGADIREDIGLQALKAHSEGQLPGGKIYAAAGVDVAMGELFVDCIKSTAAATHGLQVLEGLGGFGALYDLHSLRMREPVLVSGTDGVGTKLLVAHAVGRHDTIGQDLVAMCLNDILCHGARPLFFLDYLATGKLDVSVLKEVVKGIAKACRDAHTALVGGETAEMPGMYRPGQYDVAGFAVGVVERDQILPRRGDMAEEDCVIGLPSSGLHSNGYSLVRKIIEEMHLKYTDECPFEKAKTIGDVLLSPTRLYVSEFLSVIKSVLGAAHITGGGIIGNAARMLPSQLGVQLDINKWTVPREFLWLAMQGVSPEEMAKTFNLGLGMIIVVKKEDKEHVLHKLAENGGREVGQLKKWNDGEDRVSIAGLHSHISALVQQFQHQLYSMPRPQQPRVRTAILISGRGSNMKAIVEATLKPGSAAEVVLVLSNIPGAAGLGWAEQHKIKTTVVNHKDFKDRLSFETVVQQRLLEEGVQLVCLAGFMRILTGGFVSQWRGRLINIHPSLLPSFKGKDAQKQALDAGVKITGCSVHFVETEVDSGAIIQQAAVPVMPGDTEDTLSDRIILAEHDIFPRSVLLVASKIQKEALKAE